MNDSNDQIVWQAENTHPELAANTKQALRQVVDPELGLNIIELGLVRNLIIEKLKAAVDPETGQRFVEKIVKKEEAFAGPFLNDAPDILIKTKNLDYLPSTNYYFRKGFRRKSFGNHKMEGILILHGPPFKRNHRLHGSHIQDCMPIIFYLLGVPIPSDFDGRILEEGFLKEYLQAHRAEFRDPMPFDAEAKSKDALSTYTAEQSEMIHERLKSLGYID